MLSDDILDTLIELGFKDLVIQAGKSDLLERVVDSTTSDKINVELYRFKSSIADDISKADTVVGHAGAGTCLEVLRAGKKLIVVPNESLMDDHQTELADQLVDNGYALKASLSTLKSIICLSQSSTLNLKLFPQQEPDKFKRIFEESLRRAKDY